MNLDRKYVEFIDPGHGWCAVPMEVLRELGIDKQITPYSYISWSGKTAYLEEDVDAETFIKALEARGITYRRGKHRHADGGSSIRKLPGYPSC